MARTNQGVFKEYSNQYEAYKREYEKLMNQYRAQNFDFFEGVAQNSGELYENLISLAIKLDGLNESTKMENEKNTIKYRNMKNGCDSMSDELKSRFNKVVCDLKHSGGLSDMEERTIKHFSIYER